SDLKEIEFLLHQDIGSSLKDSIVQKNHADPADNFIDSMPEMFTDEHALDYSSPPIFDEFDDDCLKVESDTKNEFGDELALITFPSRNNDLLFDIESDLKEIEYLLNHDPTKEMDFILDDLIDEDNLANLNDNLIDTMPEMFTDEHALDYSSPPLYDEYDDDLFEVEFDTEYVYDDPFDSKEEKIKESKLLIHELDLPRSSDFLPSLEYDSFLFKDFSEVDALPSTNNEEKVFNPGILIQENLSESNVQATTDKNVKKISISHAS
nr:hypothetical protein [Tanacetum cinerariifolium]